MNPPFMLVLCTITNSSANNKCLFLKIGAHLFEWFVSAEKLFCYLTKCVVDVAV